MEATLLNKQVNRANELGEGLMRLCGILFNWVVEVRTAVREVILLCVLDLGGWLCRYFAGCLEMRWKGQSVMMLEVTSANKLASITSKQRKITYLYHRRRSPAHKECNGGRCR